MEKQIEYFENNYVIIADIHTLPDGEKIQIGSVENKICRYCGKDSSAVTFKKVAHAIPEFIGNKKLFANDECDNCNHHFSIFVEDHFAKFMGTSRTISQIKGKGGVPSFKTKQGNSRIDFSTKGLKVQERSDDKIFEIDKINNMLVIQAHKQPYIPMGVFKCLVKMAIAIMPVEEINNFRETLTWILERGHSGKSFRYSPMSVLYSFMPGPSPHPGIKLLLLRRKNDRCAVPYMVFVLAFANYMYQINVPSISKDSSIYGKNIIITYFPTPFDVEKPYGKIQRSHIDLSSTSAVIAEVSSISMQFDCMVEFDPKELDQIELTGGNDVWAFQRPLL